MHHISPRRAAVALSAVLVGAALPLVVAPAPALAAEPCTSEASPLPLVPGCDDAAAPTTTITGADPSVSTKWIRQDSVAISFTGAHTDGDTDPLGYECQFDTPTKPPSDWEGCTSPARFTGLDEWTEGAQYTFRVRAVDTADNAIDLVSPIFGGTDTPDYDESPAAVQFRVDTTAPTTFGTLRSNYYDEDRQDVPMVTSPTVQIRLFGGEAAPGADAPVYQCRLNDQRVACNDGITTLAGLGAGMQRFTAAAVDPAGNVDPTPFEQRFFVPRDLNVTDATRASRDAWRNVRGPSSFAGDYLETTTYGATLTFRVNSIRAIRLLAPSGPGLGKVQVRVGRGGWTTVNLASSDTQRLRVYQVRDELSGMVAGPLQIRVASKNKPVRVDAVMAR